MCVNSTLLVPHQLSPPSGIPLMLGSFLAAAFWTNWAWSPKTALYRSWLQQRIGEDSGCNLLAMWKFPNWSKVPKVSCNPTYMATYASYPSYPSYLVLPALHRTRGFARPWAWSWRSTWISCLSCAGRSGKKIADSSCDGLCKSNGKCHIIS